MHPSTLPPTPVQPSGQPERPNLTLHLPPVVWLAFASVLAFVLAPDVCLALVAAMQDGAVLLASGAGAGAGALVVRSRIKREPLELRTLEKRPH